MGFIERIEFQFFLLGYLVRKIRRRPLFNHPLHDNTEPEKRFRNTFSMVPDAASKPWGGIISESSNDKKYSLKTWIATI